jgi:hypothetical protein
MFACESCRGKSYHKRAFGFRLSLSAWNQKQRQPQKQQTNTDYTDPSGTDCHGLGEVQNNPIIELSVTIRVHPWNPCSSFAFGFGVAVGF